MTVIPDPALQVAKAVVERIATDGFCNTGNIHDAVFREMAVIEAAKPKRIAPVPQQAMPGQMSYNPAFQVPTSPPQVRAAAQSLFTTGHI